MGSAFAGALNTHAGNVRQDERNAELREQQLADREQLFSRQDMTYARGRADTLGDRSALWDRQDGIRGDSKADAKTAKEQEEAQEAAAVTGAVAALAQSGYLTADQLAFFDSVPPKQRAGVAEQLIKFGGLNAAQMAQDQQAEASRSRARQTYPLTNPNTGEPHLGHIMTGNGQTLPVMQPKAEAEQWTPGMVQQFGQQHGLNLGGASVSGTGAIRYNYDPPESANKPGASGGLLYNQDVQ